MHRQVFAGLKIRETLPRELTTIRDCMHTRVALPNLRIGFGDEAQRTPSEFAQNEPITGLSDTGRSTPCRRLPHFAESGLAQPPSPIADGALGHGNA